MLTYHLKKIKSILSAQRLLVADHVIANNVDTSGTTVREEGSQSYELEVVTDMSEFRSSVTAEHQRHHAHSISWLLKMSSAFSQL